MLEVESSASPRIVLPPPPGAAASDPVAAWREPVLIDSYLPEAPDRFPAYLESRVYQGSSGRVFPLPFHERIASERTPHEWDAVHLENEWVRVMILPELGGRIHIAYDKVADYDIFYRNNVIKPALVGLAGPWIAGGVEFNWPQHHRPATFLPTDVEIEHEPDGSVTVWCSDHDPFARMKGMHGIRLRPDSSLIEARVRLLNRTEVPQTFLWWANVAAAVNDDYQSFFPTDVAVVADHARRATTTFPHADRYYGVDYAGREGDADRIDWWRNIPVPTSYMVLDTQDDYFGGYDHGRDAGFVHWADRRIAPGKKQWTWGNSPFGEAWERNLTDGDGPYIELMAGVFTDNQPDFAWLAPGETRTFSQYWYPIQRIGPVQAATVELAASIHEGRLGLAASVPQDVEVVVTDAEGAEVLRESLRAGPGSPVLRDLDGVAPHRLSVLRDGAEALVLGPREATPSTRSAAVAPPRPGDVDAADELHLIGRYLEQYRHATRRPEPYWEEALTRDPGHAGAHLSLGAAAYASADYDRAVHHLERAVARLTEWTPTPIDGEALYRLGLALGRRGDDEAAETALARAAWDARWVVPASFALARGLSSRQRWDEALAALDTVLAHDPQHSQAACLRARIDRERGGEGSVAEVLDRDPLDQWARDLAGMPLTGDATILLDVALEYAGAGFVADALRVLDLADAADPHRAVGQVAVAPLVAFHRARLLAREGRSDAAARELRRADSLDLTGCLPSRLDDVDALVAAGDVAAAQTLLGHWLYDRGRRHDAIAAWIAALAATADDATRSVLHRNLGVAAYNVARDPALAADHYERALSAAPADAKLLYERDQLAARRGEDPASRLARLRESGDAVRLRDDLTVALAELLTDTGAPREALAVLSERAFQPWEGGEGQVLGAWERANAAAAGSADPERAVAHLRAALEPPRSLGEARHPLANSAHLHLALGDALARTGDEDAARAEWRRAADAAGDFTGMRDRTHSIRTAASIRALRRLGEHPRADELLDEFERYTDDLARTRAEVDFFATSLPTMLLFVDDPQTALDEEVAQLRQAIEDLRAASQPGGDDAADAARLRGRSVLQREGQS